MLTKIDVLGIVEAHAGTLVNARTHRRSWSDAAGFYGVPAVAAAASFWAGASIGDTGATALITALAVFAGLLFNLLVLAQTLRGGSTSRRPRERQLLREISVNMEYAILVALATIAALLVPVLVAQPHPTAAPTWANLAASLARRGASAAAAGLTVHFLLTLLMVLRRMHVVLLLESEDPPRPGPLTSPLDRGPDPRPARPAPVAAPDTSGGYVVRTLRR